MREARGEAARVVDRCGLTAHLAARAKALPIGLRKRLEVREKEIIALVGANAAGKSTTLRVVSGLVTPRHGRVLFTDQDLTSISAHRRPSSWKADSLSWPAPPASCRATSG